MKPPKRSSRARTSEPGDAPAEPGHISQLDTLREERQRSRPRSIKAWHQGPVDRDVDYFQADAPRFYARYHRAGGVRTWYGSSTSHAAWSELIRHWEDEEIDPFEARRRVGWIRFDDLIVLDLTTDRTREALGVTVEDLVDDDYSKCQELSELAQLAGFEAILAPSAALSGRTTLAVFGDALTRRTTEVTDLSIRQPPLSMRKLLPLIRKVRKSRRT